MTQMTCLQSVLFVEFFSACTWICYCFSNKSAMMIFVQGLHAKLVQEQESWTEELKCKQEVLAKHTKLLENKEAEIKRDLEILTEERRLAINEIKRFAEMESRIWEAERDLQTKHEQHLQEVSKQNKQFLSSRFEWVLAKSVGGATVESILVMSFLYDRSCTWICPVIPEHLTMCISLSLCAGTGTYK